MPSLAELLGMLGEPDPMTGMVARGTSPIGPEIYPGPPDPNAGPSPLLQWAAAHYATQDPLVNEPGTEGGLPVNPGLSLSPGMDQMGGGPSDLAMRLAAALSTLGPYTPRRGEHGLGRVAANVLSGGARGFVGATAAEQARADKAKAANETLMLRLKDRAAAQNRKNIAASGSLIRGNRGVLGAGSTAASKPAPEAFVTAQMAQDYGFPASAVGMRVSELPPELRGKTPRLSGSGMGLFGQSASAFEPEAIADGIVSGNLAADPAGYSRGQWGMISTSLQKRGFNAREAQLDWVGTRRYWTTRNGNQQLNIIQNLERLGPSLDLVDELSANLRGLVPRSRVRILTRASLAAAKDGAYGEEAKAAAQQLETQINDTVFELQQVYGNGYSPTDQALKIARENLRSDWNERTLKAGTDLARRNIRIRRSSVSNVTASTPSNPTGAVESGNTVIEYVRDANGRLVPK